MIDQNQVTSGVLDEKRHNRLIANIDEYAQRAGLTGAPHHIWNKLPFELSENEINYYKGFRDMPAQGICGMYYEKQSEILLDRFMALTGMMLRNFVDARVVMKSEIFDANAKGYRLTGSLLFIPDFFVADEGTKVHEFKVEALTDFLIHCMKEGIQIVPQISNMKRMESAYGKVICNHFLNFAIDEGDVS